MEGQDRYNKRLSKGAGIVVVLVLCALMLAAFMQPKSVREQAEPLSAQADSTTAVNGTEVPKEAVKVVQSDGANQETSETYPSMEAAFVAINDKSNAAYTNVTVTMLEDCTMTNQVTFDNKSVEIKTDGKGLTLTDGRPSATVSLITIGDSASLTLSGNLTIDGGSSSSVKRRNKSMITVGNTVGKGSLVIKDNVTISNYYSTAEGGALTVNGTFTMEGGTISNNVSEKQGGAVCVNGTAIMKNGTISSNKSGTMGGGVCISSQASFTMEGGKITDNTSGTKDSKLKYGAGIYAAGKYIVKSGLINVSENDGDDVYLIKNNKITYESKLNSGSVISVALADAAQECFTENFGTYYQSLSSIDEKTTNVKSSNSKYTLAQNKDGELYIGYKVTFKLSDGGSDYFEGENAQKREKTYILHEKSHPELPNVIYDKKAVDYWELADGSELAESDVITEDVTATVKWIEASVCHIDKIYYKSVDLAVKSANKTPEKDTILICDDSVTANTINVTSDIEIKSESDRRHLAKSDKGPLLMIKVTGGGKLTLENVEFNGFKLSNSLLSVEDGGAATIGKGVLFTNNQNAIRDYKDNERPGTIYVGKKGTVNMNDGSISDNSAIIGGGVYIDSEGTFVMHGGSITKNKLTANLLNGAGVYLAKGGSMSVSGSAKVNENMMADGVTQNIYYIVDSNADALIHMDGVLSSDASIGVTPSSAPTGIDHPLWVTVADDKGKSLEQYKDNTIFSDNPRYETIVDDIQRKIRLRKGHTVTFDVGEGKFKDSEVSTKVDVVDGKTIKETTGKDLPEAEKEGKMFDGWYDDTDTKIYDNTPITKSMTLKALYTDGVCEKPEAAASSEGKIEDTLEGTVCYGESAKITLSSKTEGCEIYYTLDDENIADAIKNKKAIKYDAPIELKEDTTIYAVAVKYGYSTSEVLEVSYTICNVTDITWQDKPDTVFRGYEAQFSAVVETGNDSTPKTVKWELVNGEYAVDTSISSDGKLTVSPKEPSENITVRASSQDPDKYIEITVPVKNQYVVKYDKNAPTGSQVTGIVEDKKSPYLEGSEVTVFANGSLTDESNQGFNCSGYAFKSWNTKQDGSGESYKGGETFEIKENVTLYAQWEVVVVVNKITITPKSANIYQGEDYTFTAQVSGKGNLSGEVVWGIEGQSMEGTQINEEGVLHVDIDETSDVLTISATSKDDPSKWAKITVNIKELVRYDLTYAAMGGVGDMSAENKSYISGTAITVAECAYTRDGYDFVSWNTASNGNGNELYPGDSYVISQNVVMYAQWKRTSTASGDASGEAVVENTERVKTDKEIAEETIALIDAIGDVTKDSLPAIQAARESYDALTDAQKALVGETEYNKLTIRESMYKELFAGGTKKPVVVEKPKVGDKSVVINNVKQPLKLGAEFVYGRYLYRVTKSALKGGTVTLVQPVKRSIKSSVIAKKVTYGDVTYKVTAISPKAFKNCKNLTKVKITKNITSIGKQAFSGAKNLKAVNVKSRKINSIGKQAFSKIAKNAYIKMPDKKYRQYEKLLKKVKLNKNIRLKTY